jgi:hypothetical protein
MHNLDSSTNFMQNKEIIKLYIHFHVSLWDMPTINTLFSSARLYSLKERIKNPKLAKFYEKKNHS